jgi:arylsulfatase A-like enzyme
LQATEKHLERVSQIKDDVRRNYAGLVVGLDDAIGEVLKKLKETDQEEKTLVFFMSDNGGPTPVTHSDNAPLRGSKGSVYEGGMRVPFLVSWPGQLSKGKDYTLPVSSLDVFATAVDLAKAKVPDSHHSEGVNLIPYLKGDKKESPHEQLFWRSSENWAVRSGDMKLLGTAKAGEEMFNLGSDIGEEHNLSKEDSNSKTNLRSLYDAWNSKKIPPIFSGPKDDKRQKKAAGK